MKEIGILTFHAAHNYGSLLQNFALQRTLATLGYSPITINLRTAQQKEKYSPFKPFSELIDKRRIVLTLAYMPWKKQLLQKARLFEDFLKKELILTDEVSSQAEIDELPSFDAYIAGSDQIWNVYAKDFCWSYFLDFVKKGTTKISYAASMGTSPTQLLSDPQRAEKVSKLLSDFDAISVREEKTKSVVEKLTGKKSKVLVDPTLLLESKEWCKHISEKPLKWGRYILLYNPYYLPDVYSQAKILSTLTDLPVVTTNINIKGIIHGKGIEKKLDVGPWEFLNLVKNASYVIGRSFHLLAFACIFNKKFIAVNGMGDSRLNNLLTITGLQGCATSDGDVKTALKANDNIDWNNVNAAISQERLKSLDFLQNSLGEI